MNLVRLCLAMALFAGAIAMSGCCGPCGSGMIGPGCSAGATCGDCSGAGAAMYCPTGPVDALRNARRRMVCGSGCGEVYQGEWISTPPDSADPCRGDQFVGGASKCRPYCWERGTLLRGLYGKRVCSGAASSTPCDCGCGGTTVCERVQARRAARAACRCQACSSAVVETYVEEPVVSHPVVQPASSSCGCTACNSPKAGGTVVARASKSAAKKTAVR